MSNKNVLLKKRCKSVPKINLDKKLNEKFLEKCYFYALPINWSEEYDYLNIDDSKSIKLTNIYNNVKQQLTNKAITLCDILKIVNITHNERIELIEEYAFMQSYDSDIKEYTRLREQLRKKMSFLTNRELSLSEVNNMDKQRNKLAHISLSGLEIEEKILLMKCDEYTQAAIYQKYLKMKGMSVSDSEYHKLNDWLNFVVKIPFNISKAIELKCDGENIISMVKRKLDKEIYGMTNVKEEIILFLRQKLKNPESSHLSLSLCGPPGVGKTKIIRTLSEILNIPFEHISMGGVNEVSYLSGDSYVYEGSRPGKLLQTACKLNCDNGIMFFDEVDKIGNSNKAQEVSKKLMHITDFTQNSIYSDNYCSELNFDMSKIWYMFSMNDEIELDPILRDRMYIINVPGYDMKDKLKIMESHILPEILLRYKMSEDDIIVDSDVRKFIIGRCKEEKGIRELKRVVELIYRKLDVLCDLYKDNDKLKMSFHIDNFQLPHKLTCTDVRTLMKGYDVKAPIPGLYV
jgi:ATP-dependent Lon protease